MASVPALELHVSAGVSRRDFFAAHAMAALIAKIPLHDRQGEHGVHMPEVSDIHQVRRDVAESAFDYADAMEERVQVSE